MEKRAENRSSTSPSARDPFLALTRPLARGVGVVLAALAVASLAVSCRPDGAGSGEGDKRMTIGMMPKLVGIDFFNACEKGAKEAAEELGVELVYDGPIKNDVTKQAEMLDTWITRGFDAIAVAPNDPNALAPTLRKAMERDIEVVTWDADSKADSRDLFVNQAEFAAIGALLVDVMAEEIDGKGQVAIVTGSLTAANQNTWMEHMRARVAAAYPEMEIVTVKPAQEDQQVAFQVAQDLLKAYPDLAGIFGITSVALPGAAEAVRQAGKSGQVAVTGLSTPNQMRQYVKDGTVKAFVLWSPVDLGYLAVHVAKRLVEEGSVPESFSAGRLGAVGRTGAVVLLGPPLRFDAENIDQFDF